MKLCITKAEKAVQSACYTGIKNGIKDDVKKIMQFKMKKNGTIYQTRKWKKNK